VLAGQSVRKFLDHWLHARLEVDEEAALKGIEALNSITAERIGELEIAARPRTLDEQQCTGRRRGQQALEPRPPGSINTLSQSLSISMRYRVLSTPTRNRRTCKAWLRNKKPVERSVD